MPKSRTLTLPLRVRNMFSGLMSRWTTPLACAAASTSRSCVAIERASTTGSRRSLRSHRRSTVSPSSSSMTRKTIPSSSRRRR